MVFVMAVGVAGLGVAMRPRSGQWVTLFVEDNGLDSCATNINGESLYGSSILFTSCRFWGHVILLIGLFRFLTTVVNDATVFHIVF